MGQPHVPVIFVAYLPLKFRAKPACKAVISQTSNFDEPVYCTAYETESLSSLVLSKLQFILNFQKYVCMIFPLCLNINVCYRAFEALLKCIQLISEYSLET